MILLLALIWPGLVLAQSPDARLLTMFTNPTPVSLDYFGASLAEVGNDRVLIGADGAGEAYLFNLSGTLQTTFTNPATSPNGFGRSVTAVGSDRVLIGAPFGGAGTAYLFSTNGTLLTTFTNPSPAIVTDLGRSVAAVGSDRVIISGLANGAPYVGGVFLFRSDGTLLTTITNPSPAHNGGFGDSVVAVGSDLLVISSPSFGTYLDGMPARGAAYLFNTNGTLLTTFTNPIPVFSGQFGTAVAAVGNDRVLIGETQNGGTPTGGAAYLFSTNGTLLITFNNPTPAAYEIFGSSVAAVGNNRVLIGALGDNTGAPGAGSAYLFSTNGTLLNTFTNPTPTASDVFGSAVAAVGGDQLIIAADQDSTDVPYAGSAYLYALPYPPLSIARNGSAVSLKWTTPETGIALQQTDALDTSTVWSDTTNSISANGQTNIVQQTMVTTNRFFRLHRP
jgi:hypothetical protein